MFDPFSPEIIRNLTVLGYERQIEKGLSHDEAMAVLYSYAPHEKCREITTNIITEYLGVKTPNPLG